MNTQQKITVSISPLGVPTIEAHNFHGAGCDAATKPIEDALSNGGGMTRVLKPEWQETSPEEHQEQHVRW